MVIELKDAAAKAFIESLRPRSEHTARSYAHAVGGLGVLDAGIHSCTILLAGDRVDKGKPPGLAAAAEVGDALASRGLGDGGAQLGHDWPCPTDSY
jgi:hypothetical protein